MLQEFFYKINDTKLKCCNSPQYITTNIRKFNENLYKEKYSIWGLEYT